MNLQENKTEDNYYDYLASKYWTGVKRVMWEKYRKCQICGAKTGLEVHHLTYENFYNEDLQKLRLLCRVCHQRQHFTLLGRKIALVEKTLRKRYRLLKVTYKVRTLRSSTVFAWLFAEKRHA